MTEAAKRRLKNESIAMCLAAVALSGLVWGAMLLLQS